MSPEQLEEWKRGYVVARQYVRAYEGLRVINVDEPSNMVSEWSPEYRQGWRAGTNEELNRIKCARTALWRATLLRNTQEEIEDT